MMPHAAYMQTLGLETLAARYAVKQQNTSRVAHALREIPQIRRATNLFDNKTLAIHPYSTIFGNFSPQEKAAMDVSPTTIRLSIGLEDSTDIINDIKQALS